MIYKLAVVSSLVAAATGSPILTGATLGVEAKWEAWKAQYKFEGDEKAAFAKFAATEERINTHNAKGLSYTLGHNQFSAMTPQEFKDKVVGHANMTRAGPYSYEDLSGVQIASSVDWVAKGAVTPVKNQEQCGSCWA